MFKGIINQTALLESLGWDEEAYKQLVDFIDSQNHLFIPTHPVILLNEVEEYFGKNTRDVLETIFKEEIDQITGDKNEN